MQRSPLFGRRIHLTGSIAKDLSAATTEDVDRTRAFVAGLVAELVRKGANFVLPVDAEPRRDADGRPICFDWLIWQTIEANVFHRPKDVPGPMAVAVQHHKTEQQIPEEYRAIWQKLRGSDLVRIDNASFWNMNSKRMEIQAHWGDVLIPIGGTEGVQFLANLYHDAGKHIVPINLPVTGEGTGARKLFAFGLSRTNSKHLLRTSAGEVDPHGWINRINFTSATSVADMVRQVIGLIEALEAPRAFAVRLLNPEHADFKDVQDFFDIVVKPVIEQEFGYRLVIVDGVQMVEQSRIDADIFAKLHRSRAVVADLTGDRPNCFLELGYALGRGLPTIVTAKHGSKPPFDLATFAGFHWKTTGTVEERRTAFREHWASVLNRPPFVDTEPLIQ